MAVGPGRTFRPAGDLRVKCRLGATRRLRPPCTRPIKSASTKKWSVTVGTCSTCGSPVRSTHAIDDRLVAPGATTAVLPEPLGERTLLNWFTGPNAPCDTSMLVIAWYVASVTMSGRPYTYAFSPTA